MVASATEARVLNHLDLVRLLQRIQSEDIDALPGLGRDLQHALGHAEGAPTHILDQGQEALETIARLFRSCQERDEASLAARQAARVAEMAEQRIGAELSRIRGHWGSTVGAPASTSSRSLSPPPRQWDSGTQTRVILERAPRTTSRPPSPVKFDGEGLALVLRDDGSRARVYVTTKEREALLLLIDSYHRDPAARLVGGDAAKAKSHVTNLCRPGKNGKGRTREEAALFAAVIDRPGKRRKGAGYALRQPRRNT
jgi:hypothetical protein